MSLPDSLVPEVIISGEKQLSEMNYFIDTVKNMLNMVKESSKPKAPSGPGYDLFLKCSLCYLGESYENGRIDLSDDGRATVRDIEKHLSSKEHHTHVNERRKPGYITCMVCDQDIDLSYDNFISQNVIIPHLRELDHEANQSKVKNNIKNYAEVEPASYQLMPSQMGEIEHAVSSLSMKVGILGRSFADFIIHQQAIAEEMRMNESRNGGRHFQGPPMQHENHFENAHPMKRAHPFNKLAAPSTSGHFMKGGGPFKNHHAKQFNSHPYNQKQFPGGFKQKNEQFQPALPFNRPMNVSKYSANHRPKRPHIWCNLCMNPIMLEADRTKVFKVLASHLKGVKHGFNQENNSSNVKFFNCSVCSCKVLMSNDHDISLKNLDEHLDGITHIEKYTQIEIDYALE